MKKLLFLSLIFLCKFSFAATYYVAPNGNDNNLGTSTTIPFATVTKAVSKAIAGDFIYLRGGTYNITAKITINKSGTAAAKITIQNYLNEKPIINGSSMGVGTNNRGMDLNGSYWVIKGIEFTKCGDNGLHISGAYNLIELCVFSENRDTGCQLSNGANNNNIVNCDSYFNRDSTSSTNYDGNADGFAAKLDVGVNNSYKGCRAWQNSDDGWDGLLSTGATATNTNFDSCWCFMNGYYKSGKASIGNGNGFKMGGNNEVNDVIMTRCLSAFNRVKGFDQNNNNGSMTLYNCTGYKNKPNFGMNNNDPNAGKVMIVKNCISFGGTAIDVFRTVCVRTNNSWQAGVTTTTADFLTVDSIGLRGPRKADGSLPDINFMHLANGSDLIDAGTNLALPFNGSNPDLGCFESNYVLPVKFGNYTVVLKNIDGKNSVTNTWNIETEINTAYYNIQQSADAKQYVTVGKVEAKKLNQYSFQNLLNSNSNVVYYRIEAVDFDGTTIYSEVKKLDIQKTKTQIKLYPNPAKDVVNISNLENVSSISISNILGKEVVRLNKALIQNNIDISTLKAGTYLIKFLKVDGSFEVLKFVKEN